MTGTYFGEPAVRMKSTRLRRSVHFVPGANERMLKKSLSSAADCLVLDLEDAVVPARKHEARAVIADWLRGVDFGRQERIVRINPLESPWGYDDLVATMDFPPDAFLVPKVRTLADVMDLDAEITRLEHENELPEGGVELILIATETPLGALNVPSFTRCPRVRGLAWGAEDLSAALGARQTRDESGRHLDVFGFARAHTLLAAGAAGIDAVDAVYVDVRDLDGLRRESREAAWSGFAGKITIHPEQVPIVNEAFSVTAAELTQAEALVAAFAEAEREGRNAFSFDGRMVDAPHLARAQRLIDRARRIAEAHGHG